MQVTHDLLVDGSIIGLAIAAVRFGEYVVKRAFRSPHRLSEHEYQMLKDVLELCKKSHINNEKAAYLVEKLFKS